MPLERIDVRDDAAFMEWFGVLERSTATRTDHPGDHWRPEEIRARAINDDAPKNDHLLSYRHHGEVVAAVLVEVTKEDNLHFLRAELDVDPRHLRQGHGTAALKGLEAYARELGRPKLLIGAVEPLTQVGKGASRFFAPKFGYSIAEDDVRRDLTWPRPPGTLEALMDEWRPFAEEYELLTWVTPSPPKWLGDLAVLNSRINAEAPHADLEVDPEIWNEDRQVRHEATVDEMNRHLLIAAARHKATDTLAAYTELTVPKAEPSHSWQWATLVLPEHRGHRLGGLVKVVNLLQLAALGYPVERISTYNAAMNPHMIGVNERIGAVVSGARLGWAKAL